MTELFRKIYQKARDPINSGIGYVGSRRPEIVLRRYSELARAQGFTRVHFILSFDCDTEKDIEVIPELHARLAKVGVTPVYAVPGELLKKGAAVYRQIAESGAEFINHGYAIHTVLENGQYRSTIFYDQLTAEEVCDDIRRGHQTILDVLGRRSTGFRVPHFGTFQRPEQRALVYHALAQLGYRFSTSTVPLAGLRHGPVWQVQPALCEIPVSGCFDNPSSILDSWGFRFAPDRKRAQEEYLQQVRKIVRFFSQPDRFGLLNYYVDPSQVYDWQDFFESVELLAPFAIRSYEELFKRVIQ